MLRGDYTCKWDSVITQGKAIAYLVLSLFCSRLWCNWNFSVLALDSAHSLVGVFAFWMVCLVYSHEIQIMGFVLWFMYSPSEWFIWLLLQLHSCFAIKFLCVCYWFHLKPSKWSWNKWREICYCNQCGRYLLYYRLFWDVMHLLESICWFLMQVGPWKHRALAKLFVNIEVW